MRLARQKQSGGQGWADVWFKGHFAVEYKGPHGDLDRAYTQLLQYRESLDNPPLLIVSNIQTIVVHTNFTGTAKHVVTIMLDDLLTPAGLQQLRNIFYNPEAFRPEKTAAEVTEEAAAQFGRLAAHLAKWGYNPHDVAHYLIRLLFCLFAEDIELLPRDLFTRLVDHGRRDSARFNRQIKQLFHAMAEGDEFGEYSIRYFNGGLFDGDATLDIDGDGLAILHNITQLDWASIEPAIFGTLFTRSLDPSQRAKLGAQYTSKDDILLIVEPVLMAPLRREWAETKAKAQELARKRASAPTRAVGTRLQNELSSLILGFAQKLASVRVLDPACGSGNFLYVSLRLLLELWKEVSIFASEVGLSLLTPLPGLAPSPLQLYGIEISDYAHELAQATVWIGYLQWLHGNGFGFPEEPILKPLDNIRHMDAILAYDADGRPVEPEWQEADAIVGNPPFLGGNRVRQELGDKYVDSLFKLYENRISAFADFVCDWFEKARTQIQVGQAKRVGLLATNSIRQGTNRKTLERIKEVGDIFLAWSDRPWILDGAAVRVSMIGFDDGEEQNRLLNGGSVLSINSDLTSTLDLSVARRLKENDNLCFYGSQQKGAFNISEDQARALLAEPNTFGKSARDVVKRGLNSQQLMQRTEEAWVIDFGLDMPLEEAAKYESAFRYVKEVVYPERIGRNEKRQREYWWLHARPSPGYRRILANQNRYVVTPSISKYRIFVWRGSDVLANHRLFVFARDDDYFFGVLHSRCHELWSLKTGSWMGVGNDPCYTSSTCFETYPFPWRPGEEPQEDPRVHAIADAARDLTAQRKAWLNPPGLSENELQKRTLTNLYNQRPDWLDAAHKKLDAAVFDAYGWPHDLRDEEILARLLALNLQRAGTQLGADSRA